MKALTISQPYASLIADGAKWVENRKWPTSYRGPLAIHAGKGTQYLDRSQLSEYPSGAVVAVCSLVACVRYPLSFPPDVAQLQRVGVDTNSFHAHEHTEGPWCWVLRDVHRIRRPFPCRGAQGLWNLPPEIEAQVREVLLCSPSGS